MCVCACASVRPKPTHNVHRVDQQICVFWGKGHCRATKRVWCRYQRRHPVYLFEILYGGWWKGGWDWKGKRHVFWRCVAVCEWACASCLCSLICWGAYVLLICWSWACSLILVCVCYVKVYVPVCAVGAGCVLVSDMCALNVCLTISVIGAGVCVLVKCVLLRSVCHFLNLHRSMQVGLCSLVKWKRCSLRFYKLTPLGIRMHVNWWQMKMWSALCLLDRWIVWSSGVLWYVFAFKRGYNSFGPYIYIHWSIFVFWGGVIAPRHTTLYAFGEEENEQKNNMGEPN